MAATLVKFAMLPPMMRILPGFAVRETKKGVRKVDLSILTEIHLRELPPL